MALKNKPVNVVGYETTINKKECGAYTLTDTVSGNVYVGSTVDIHRRKINHFSGLCNNRHFNKQLQAAFNGRGLLELEFIPVDKNLPTDQIVNAAREMERKLIDVNLKRGTLMNRSLDPYCPGKGVSPSQETREKLKVAMTGRFVSDETRKKRSETMSGVIYTDDRKLAISLARTANSVLIDGINYRNATVAAKEIKSSKATIKRRCESDKYPNYQLIPTVATQLGNAPHRL